MAASTRDNTSPVTEEQVALLRTLLLGELAAGVVHDVNNPLGAVIALVQVMKRDAVLAAEDRELIEEIETAAQRCQRIIESVLVFARGPRGEARDHVEVASVIRDALHVARGFMRSGRVDEDIVIDDALCVLAGAPAGAVAALVHVLVSLLHQAVDVVQGTGAPSGAVRVRAVQHDAHTAIDVVTVVRGSTRLAEPRAKLAISARNALLHLPSSLRVAQHLAGTLGGDLQVVPVTVHDLESGIAQHVRIVLPVAASAGLPAP
jgi:K+-sensing histidine kinase KdpD